MDVVAKTEEPGWRTDRGEKRNKYAKSGVTTAARKVLWLKQSSRAADNFLRG